MKDEFYMDIGPSKKHVGCITMILGNQQIPLTKDDARIVASTIIQVIESLEEEIRC